MKHSNQTPANEHSSHLTVHSEVDTLVKFFLEGNPCVAKQALFKHLNKIPGHEEKVKQVFEAVTSNSQKRWCAKRITDGMDTWLKRHAMAQTRHVA